MWPQRQELNERGEFVVMQLWEDEAEGGRGQVCGPSEEGGRGWLRLKAAGLSGVGRWTNG